MAAIISLIILIAIFAYFGFFNNRSNYFGAVRQDKNSQTVIQSQEISSALENKQQTGVLSRTIFTQNNFQYTYIRLALGRNKDGIPKDEERNVQAVTRKFIFNTAVADTEVLREQGLSDLSGLSNSEAMLFVFGYDNRWAFWMKDMNFSIDMIWLDADKRVVDFIENVSPSTYPQSFKPRSIARYVLEVKAGMSKEMNLKIGDRFIELK